MFSNVNQTNSLPIICYFLVCVSFNSDYWHFKGCCLPVVTFSELFYEISCSWFRIYHGPAIRLRSLYFILRKIFCNLCHFHLTNEDIEVLKGGGTENPKMHLCSLFPKPEVAPLFLLSKAWGCSSVSRFHSLRLQLCFLFPKPEVAPLFLVSEAWGCLQVSWGFFDVNRLRF